MINLSQHVEGLLELPEEFGLTWGLVLPYIPGTI
jgi:hypothetical protein